MPLTYKTTGLSAREAFDKLNLELRAREDVFLSTYAASVAPIVGGVGIAIPSANDEQVQAIQDGLKKLAKDVAELKKEAEKEAAALAQQAADSPSST